MQRSGNNPLPLGRQLYAARRCAQLTVQELARRAGLSTAAIYNVERPDRGGRTRTLIKLARALGLKLRTPDLAGIGEATWIDRR